MNLKEFYVTVNDRSLDHDVTLYGLSIVVRKDIEADFWFDSDAILRTFKRFQAFNDHEIGMQGRGRSCKFAQLNEAFQLAAETRMRKYSRFINEETAFEFDSACATAGTKRFGSLAGLALSADTSFSAEKHAASATSLALEGYVGFEVVRARRLGQMRRSRLGEFDADVLDQVDHIAL